MDEMGVLTCFRFVTAAQAAVQRLLNIHFSGQKILLQIKSIASRL
jgi:hypothetical protein